MAMKQAGRKTNEGRGAPAFLVLQEDSGHGEQGNNKLLFSSLEPHNVMEPMDVLKAYSKMHKPFLWGLCWREEKGQLQASLQ
jgi:hypothetical protein